ncbi:MAG: DUF1203 domain-containing protein [Alphaproteobacteria bacterium]|nr:DUF1203 domain-containing protein [Alphaproteobacteria bacterium]
MDFRIRGLSSEPFLPLYGLSDAALAAQGVVRKMADSFPGYPDRVELDDVEPGKSVLLLNYAHQTADTPYRSAYAIYVREGASETYDRINEVPPVIRRRTIALRAFDAAGMIVNADLCEGAAIEPLIERLLGTPGVAYLHAHYAKFGCYSARIERA